MGFFNSPDARGIAGTGRDLSEDLDAVHHEAVIPAKAGIHFDFSPGRAAANLLLRGVGMRNPEDLPFVFVPDSDPPQKEAKRQRRKWIPAFAGMTALVNAERGGVLNSP